MNLEKIIKEAISEQNAERYLRELNKQIQNAEKYLENLPKGILNNINYNLKEEPDPELVKKYTNYIADNLKEIVDNIKYIAKEYI